LHGFYDVQIPGKSLPGAQRLKKTQVKYEITWNQLRFSGLSTEEVNCAGHRDAEAKQDAQVSGGGEMLDFSHDETANLAVRVGHMSSMNECFIIGTAFHRAISRMTTPVC
jgi:hypothetical protein